MVVGEVAWGVVVQEVTHAYLPLPLLVPGQQYGLSFAVSPTGHLLIFGLGFDLGYEISFGPVSPFLLLFPVHTHKDFYLSPY